jgi:hypothetical protein
MSHILAYQGPVDVTMPSKVALPCRLQLASDRSRIDWSYHDACNLRRRSRLILVHGRPRNLLSFWSHTNLESEKSSHRAAECADWSHPGQSLGICFQFTLQKFFCRRLDSLSKALASAASGSKYWDTQVRDCNRRVNGLSCLRP